MSQQRPRKVGAKYTGTGIAPDEHAQVELDLDYDGKRDRWNGYDPEEHQRIVEEYAKVDLVSNSVIGLTLEHLVRWEEENKDRSLPSYKDNLI